MVILPNPNPPSIEAASLAISVPGSILPWITVTPRLQLIRHQGRRANKSCGGTSPFLPFPSPSFPSPLPSPPSSPGPPPFPSPPFPLEVRDLLKRLVGLGNALAPRRRQRVRVEHGR